MDHLKFMFVAGEPSGDALAADLVRALRRQAAGGGGAGRSFEPVFFGAGGRHMREAGVDTVVDMTAHSVIGISDVLKKILTFRRLFRRLCGLAGKRQPDVVVCVDFSGFNRRLGHAIRARAGRAGGGWFQNWNPKIVQYVSPQVWASRPGRALRMRDDFDLVLSIFPFEKNWYATHAPGLAVEFVGHPMMDRYGARDVRPREMRESSVLLLPGSRKAELKRHVPVLCGALEVVRTAFPGIRASMVLPDEGLAGMARSMGLPEGLRVVIGNLPEELAAADLALASTGTVTMECAFFGVPTVALYRTSWSTYQIGRRIVSVRFLSMPNILADEAIFPEFIQHQATASSIGGCAIELLKNRARRAQIQSKLKDIIQSLGGPGASDRAARAILNLAG